MDEEKRPFQDLPWRWAGPRPQSELSRCVWLRPHALVNIAVTVQSFDIPQSPLDLGGPKRKAVMQVPVVQGPPMMALTCHSTSLLEYVKAEQQEGLREQIHELLVRPEFCAVCPFWIERAGTEHEASEAPQLSGLPWYAKVVGLLFLAVGAFVAALALPITCLRAVWRKMFGRP